MTRFPPAVQIVMLKKFSLDKQAAGLPAYKEGFKFRLQPHHLTMPFSWKTPQMIFVNSMSDLFHENMDYDYRYS
ncbi:MAG: DUF5131 family protein [Melioribacteraceae bacterium]|nr:DUF5131 family protein [Melioribacteraceae bacterium]